MADIIKFPTIEKKKELIEETIELIDKKYQTLKKKDLKENLMKLKMLQKILETQH